MTRRLYKHPYLNNLFETLSDWIYEDDRYAWEEGFLDGQAELMDTAKPLIKQFLDDLTKHVNMGNASWQPTGRNRTVIKTEPQEYPEEVKC